MSLEEIRKKIDEIDAQLLPLFVERMKCAEIVAKTKMQDNLPIFNAEREAQILDKVALCAHDFDCEAKMLYTTMMALSRARQHKMMNSGEKTRRHIEKAMERKTTLDEESRSKVVACPGVQGSFSHEAANHLFPGRDTNFYERFPHVFQAVQEGKANFGIVPVENSSAGSVVEVYDLILKYRFSIVGATTLQIRECLAVAPGGEFSSIRTVYSHPQALSQCSEIIERNHWNSIQYSNTAAAAKFIADKQDPSCAVVCSKAAAQNYGLTILQDNVQNRDGNRTRFIAIQKEMLIPDDADKISICFSLPHTTGSLYSILARFAMNGLNLTKIESRPVSRDCVGENFEYDFYLDFTGNVAHPKTLDLICELSAELPNFSFLGNYVEN